MNNVKHPIYGFEQRWRSDRGIMERICRHGVGHPDPDDDALKGKHGWAQAVHGCDGCCSGIQYPQRPATPK